MSLNGSWDFQTDPQDQGQREKWYLPDVQEDSTRFGDSIIVPFPPGSELSTILIDEPDTVPAVVWYRRSISSAELAEAGGNGEVLIIFEAVDYEADVWVDGQYCCHHIGGYTPFSISLGSDLSTSKTVVVGVRDTRDPGQPRCKQAWRDEPDGIWYHRSTGIWRDVWMESRPSCAVTGFRWETDLARGVLNGAIAFSSAAQPGDTLRVVLRKGDEVVASLSQDLAGTEVESLIELPLPALRNRMDWDQWLWGSSESRV